MQGGTLLTITGKFFKSQGDVLLRSLVDGSTHRCQTPPPGDVGNCAAVTNCVVNCTQFLCYKRDGTMIRVRSAHFPLSFLISTLPFSITE